MLIPLLPIIIKEESFMAHEYDNAFRTMENDCPKLLIPLVNEVFKTNYSLESPIELYPNEQMITSPEDEQMIRITDSNFAIIGSNQDRYHIECESNPRNNELQVRIFQYDMQVALYGHTFIGDTMHVRFPRTAVIYLRHSTKTPGTLKICIHDESKEMYREIPVIKVQKYSLEEIFEKNLLIFLPFHIFVHEKKLSLYNRDEDKLRELIHEYEYIVGKLSDLNQVGEITSLEKYCIITSMRSVLGLIAKKHQTVVKEAEKVMGGEILEYEAKTIYRNGFKNGEHKGEPKGKLENAIQVYKNCIERGMSKEDALAISELSEEDIPKELR